MRDTLICIVAIGIFIVGLVGANAIADHLPSIMLAPCVVIIGLIFGAMLAGKS